MRSSAAPPARLPQREGAEARRRSDRAAVTGRLCADAAEGPAGPLLSRRSRSLVEVPAPGALRGPSTAMEGYVIKDAGRPIGGIVFGRQPTKMRLDVGCQLQSGGPTPELQKPMTSSAAPRQRAADSKIVHKKQSARVMVFRTSGGPPEPPEGRPPCFD